MIPRSQERQPDKGNIAGENPASGPLLGINMKLTTEQIAEVCYEANRVYCEALGDHSITPWLYAPEHQIQPTIDCIRSFNVHNTPEDTHDLWCAADKKAGWIWGSEKNVKARKHPCLVPYSELSEHQKRKDILFHAIVKALTRDIN